MNENKTNERRNHPQRIRNGQIRRDFKRLLDLIAAADYEDTSIYEEAEAIAGRHALYFDDSGAVKEAE